MNKASTIIVFIIVGVMITTAIYKLLPYRRWKNTKPFMTFFPKYVAPLSKTVLETEDIIKKLGFQKSAGEKYTYTRGKAYGDFSAKSIKLKVQIDPLNKNVKVFAPFFGVLFDFGDLWKLTADIVRSK